MSQSETTAVRLKLASHWLGLTLIVLVAATWPLWTTGRELPTLPAFALLVLVPGWVDLVLLAGLTLAALRLACFGSGMVWAVGLLGALMLLDQLRWQAWAWHALLACVVLCSGPVQWRLTVLRAITIAVYAYSAIAKLDYTFATTLGQQFLEVLLSTIGLDLAALPARVCTALALFFPVAEFVAAILLVFSKTKVIGVIVAVIMHIGLAILLSPIALDHSVGVVLWNLLFAALTILLFAPQGWLVVVADEELTFVNDRRPLLPLVVAGLIGVVAPALGLIGLWDPCPSWALYAPVRERAEVLVAKNAYDELPGSLRDASPGRTEQVGLVDLDLDRWCLQQTGAPLYPGQRVTIALANHLVEQTGMTNEMRVVVRSAASRWTGERKSRTISSAGDLRKLAARSWLNTRPRM